MSMFKHFLEQRNNELWNRTVMTLMVNRKFSACARLQLANYQPAGMEFDFKYVSIISMLTGLQLAADEIDHENILAPITCKSSHAKDSKGQFQQNILTVFTKVSGGPCKVLYDVCDAWHAMYPLPLSRCDKAEMLMGVDTQSCKLPNLVNGQYPSVQFIEMFDMQTEKISYQPVMTADDMYKFLMSAFVQSKIDGIVLVSSVIEDNAVIDKVPSVELSVKRRLDNGENLMSVACDSDLFAYISNNFLFLQAYVAHSASFQLTAKKARTI